MKCGNMWMLIESIMLNNMISGRSINIEYIHSIVGNKIKDSMVKISKDNRDNCQEVQSMVENLLQIVEDCN